MAEAARQGSQRPPDPLQGGDLDENQVLELHAERATVSKRVRKTIVRAVRTTRSRDEVIEENLEHVRVVIERVPIGQLVTTVPPVRQDGDLTIMPVVEEVVVVERRLFLKEEVHMRRVRTAERFTETVKLREQQVEVTRTDVDV